MWMFKALRQLIGLKGPEDLERERVEREQHFEDLARRAAATDAWTRDMQARAEEGRIGPRYDPEQVRRVVRGESTSDYARTRRSDGGLDGTDLLLGVAIGASMHSLSAPSASVDAGGLSVGDTSGGTE